MKDTKLNNLLSMEDYSEKDFVKPAKVTKRTGVAKDVLQENAYVLGKDIFGKTKVEIPTGKGETVKVVGKEVLDDKFKNKEVHAAKGLNNLISLDDFTKAVPSTSAKATKRTDVAKDVLLERRKAKAKECKCDDKDEKDDKDCVSKKQAKLPWNKDKKICK